MSDVIYIGDALEVLKTLESESVQCCVTSPPYYGLRDYGTAQWQGGDPECAHIGMESRTVSGGEGKQYSNKGSNRVYSGNCACGAIRIDNQIGLEKTPMEYIEKMVDVFREVKRVLRGDGTLWLNIGDSYAGSGKGGNPENSEWKGFIGNTAREAAATVPSGEKRTPVDLKPKDLIGIPWRLAFALQADGWWLRQDIIWHKPNPMPESVTDRCTKSHEYIFLLTKSAKYFYDQNAVREDAKYSTNERVARVKESHKSNPDNVKNGLRQRKPAGWDTRQGAHGAFHREGRTPDIEYTTSTSMTRNSRSVWTIATSPYKEAHFATFPEAIPEICIKAGSKEGDTILDPFAGSGTVGKVARDLNRHFIMIELNEKYIELQKKRSVDLFCQPEVIAL